jgi:hypothetical protein
VQAFDAQHVAGFDRVVIGGVAVEQRHDAAVHEVLAVDARKRLRDNCP